MMTAGDKVRAIADKIKAQNEIERKALARILSASAKIAQNQDKLISEVTQMCLDDLEG